MGGWLAGDQNTVGGASRVGRFQHNQVKGEGMNGDTFTICLTFGEREAILDALVAQIASGDTRQVLRDAVQKVSISQASNLEGYNEQ